MISEIKIMMMAENVFVASLLKLICAKLPIFTSKT